MVLGALLPLAAAPEVMAPGQATAVLSDQAAVAVLDGAATALADVTALV